MSRGKDNYLFSLPVDQDDVWQCGIVPIQELGVDFTEELNSAAIVLCCSLNQQAIHVKPIDLTDISPDQGLMVTLLEFARSEKIAFRPGRIECNDRKLVESLGLLLGGDGIEVEYAGEMPVWSDIVADLQENFVGQLPPSLLDAGCTLPQVQDFATAAAAFFRAQIWDFLCDLDLLEIESPAAPKGMKFAVVLGNGSQAYGIGFYEDGGCHYDLMASNVDASDLTLVALTYEDVTSVPKPDLEMWQEHDLPLETGEAFPMICVQSADGVRRPNAKELVFATLVLQSLAKTTEDEIDSGRWTKLGLYRGKQTKCTIAIPDLLNPPDEKEWMRRGMVPDRRKNEFRMNEIQEFVSKQSELLSLDQLNQKLNEQFSGPIEQPCAPPANAADRAQSLYLQALGTYGRRRIVLAKQALREDANHLDAINLLAENERDPERRIELFSSLQDLCRQQLGEDRMQKAMGHFWLDLDTRPYMRACEGLSQAFVETGRMNEAIELNLEMLRLNPNDNQGVRYKLVPQLILSGRDAQAEEILEQYDESSAIWEYSKATIEFIRSGRSPAARAALHSAFSSNPHVVPLLQCDEEIVVPQMYSHGSREEAHLCILEMMGIWEEVEPFLAFMKSEHSSFAQNRSKRKPNQKNMKSKRERSRRRK